MTARLMMAGANPAAVQRILQHSDPKITTEVYGHLAPGYLRAEVDRLSFNLPEVAPAEAPIRAAAGADSNPFAAPCCTTRIPATERPGTHRISRVIPGRSHSARYWIRTSGLRLRRPVRGESSRSQRFATVRFPSKRGALAGPAAPAVRRESKPFVPAASPGASAASRLRVLDGGADHLLTVRAAAKRLAVSTATVYALCERGELPHGWVSNAIRIAPADLAAFLAGQRSGGR